MKVLGLIVEYNPFHNGHLYHLNKAKELVNPDLTIAITSTYFSMRGDVSLIDKKQKTDIALHYGVDIMLELPFLLACQNADIFAFNNVNFLSQMGVTTIVCGSESADLALIKQIYQLEKTSEFQSLVKAYLKEGNSYRKSYTLALDKYGIMELKSNDLLNVKYYEAIQKYNPKIELVLIKRINNDYHDEDLNASNIQSATALRRLDDIQKYIPSYANEIYQTKPFMKINAFTQIYNHLCLTHNLANLFGAKEGLENRLVPTKSLTELISKLTTKRYTASRINRLIAYLLTNTTNDLFTNTTVPIRVIGFNSMGQTYLKQIKKQVSYFTRLRANIHPVYDHELKIAKIFTNVFNFDFIKLEQSLPMRR